MLIFAETKKLYEVGKRNTTKKYIEVLIRGSTSPFVLVQSRNQQSIRYGHVWIYIYTLRDTYSRDYQRDSLASNTVLSKQRDIYNWTRDREKKKNMKPS